MPMGLSFLSNRIRGFTESSTRRLQRQDVSAVPIEFAKYSDPHGAWQRDQEAFKPKEGCVFLDADYSQIELRVLAHMSGDQELIDAYRHNQDIHRSTASKVFHTPFDQVTDLQRRHAKAVNFGIVYGISSFGLSQDLNVSRERSTAYIDQYFATYPAVKEFMILWLQQQKKKDMPVQCLAEEDRYRNWLRIILCSVRLENELQ